MIVWKQTITYRDGTVNVHWYDLRIDAADAHRIIEQEYDENYRRSVLEKIRIGDNGYLLRPQLVKWLNKHGVK